LTDVKLVPETILSGLAKPKMKEPTASKMCMKSSTAGTSMIRCGKGGMGGHNIGEQN
jgi:hypothetical protein